MKITKELLERYAKAEYSAEEQAAVEQWLEQGAGNEEIIPSADPALKAKVWADLVKRNPGIVYEKSLWLYPYRYAATALLLLTLGGLSYLAVRSYEHNSILVSNIGSEKLKTANVDGYTITLNKESYINFQQNVWRTQADVGLCGGVKLVNQTENKVTLKIHTVCGRQHDEATVTLNKGKTYVALQLDFSNDELLVVDSDRIFDLPPRLQGKILSNTSFNN